MSVRGNSKPVPVVLVLLTAGLSIIGLYAAGFGQIGPVYATLPVVVGIDCGLGSTMATLDPVTTIPISDGALDTGCSWVGDVDTTVGAPDGIIDPLVSDNPSSVPPGTGGGFTVDVRVTGLTQEINGFDVSLSYDTRYLDAVLIDQAGLFFGDPANMPFVLVKSINRSVGSVRMAEVLLAPVGATGDVTLFRVRFDVVGVGASGLDIFDDVLTSPEAVPHKTLDGSIESVSFFDPSLSLGWDVSWVSSPNPEVPGSPLTFTAAAVCPGCGALSYAWDTDSDGVADPGEPTGNPATITAPPPITHRVALTISDGTNTVVAVRRLPLAVAVQGPNSLPVNTQGTWTGLWLGDIPSATSAYRADWRFCPGGAAANAICHKPAVIVTAATGQTNVQTLNQLTAPVGAYHFAGVYTNSLKITDSTGTVSPQLGGNVVVSTTFLVEVTSTPQAYTVTLSSSAAKVNTGEQVTFTATVAYDSAYPTTAGIRSTLFDYRFDFGDGSSMTVPAGGLSATATKTYSAGGTFSVRVLAQEASASAVSKIQETSNTLLQQVNAPSAGPTVADVDVSPVSPSAGKPVTFTATVQGGAQPVTVNWDFGDGNIGQGNPVMHSYSVKGPNTVVATAVDANLQSSAPFPMDITVSAQPLVVTVVCSDGTVGKPISCDVSASGGTSPYSGTGTFSRAFEVKGTYTVSFDVADANGVPATGSDTVSIAGQPLVVTVDCPGVGLTAGKPFTCNVSATGGTAPYSGTGTMTLSFPTKGTYPVSFTVTDANDVSASGTATVTIEAQSIVADFSFTPQPPIAGQEATFTATASGGTTPYSFEWVFGDGSPLATGVTVTHTFASDLTYTVEVTARDANGFSNTASKLVDVSPPPVPFDFTVSVDPVSVKMTQGGTVTTLVTVTPTAGTAETVNLEAFPNSGLGWTVSFSTLSGTPTFTSTLTITSSLATLPDTYTFFVRGRSASDMIHETTFQLTVNPAPAELTVAVNCPDSGLTAGKPFQCDVSATGGTPPYTGTGPQTVTFPTKGTYIVSFTVTDSAAATASGSDTVTIDAQPLIVTVVCPESGLTAGIPFTCDVSATGGTAPYTGTGPMTATISAKGVQEVTFTVEDANGIIAAGTDTVTIAAQPLTVDFDFSPTDPAAGESVLFGANAVGGTIPYMFNWDFGDGGTATNDQQPTHIFAVAGDYTVVVTVTDLNSVTATMSHIVTVSPLPEFTASFTFEPANPTVGKPVSFTSTVSGGTAPYSYRWNFGDFSISPDQNPLHTYTAKGTYTVILIVTDNNNVDATAQMSVTVQSQPLVVTVVCPETGLTAGKPFECTVSATGGTVPYTGTGQRTAILPVKGTHTVTFEVTDSNSVTATGSATVTIAPQPITVDFTFTPITVTTGKPVTFTATVSGGTPPYTFSWDFGDGTAAGTGNPVSHTYPSPGTFTVTLTVADANDVSQTASRSVDVAPQPPGELVVLVVCPDSGLTAGKPFQCDVFATGGTPPYTGMGPQQVSFPVKGSQIVSFTVTDSVQASATGSDSVNIAPQPLVVDFTFTGPVTAGKPVTFASQVGGGTSPYTIHWDVNADGSFDHTGDTFATSFPVKGTISLRLHIIDNNGADAEVTKNINVDPQPLVVTVDCPDTGLTAGKPFTCNVSATGGTAPYTGTGEFSVSYPVKTPLRVSFDVTDANSITATGSDLVTIDPQPLIVIVSCPDTGLTVGKPFDCEVSATGGTAPYIGTGTFTRILTAPGTFTVTFTVTDANEVSADGTDTVQVAPQPTEQLLVTINCPSTGLTAGKPFECYISATGGTPPYTGTGLRETVLPVKGTYTVSFEVTDANLVTATGSTTVIIDPQPLVVGVECPTGLTAGKPFLCSITATGGTAPYTGTGPREAMFPAKGVHTVTFTVMDSNEETALGSTIVTIGPQPLVAEFTFTPETVIGSPVTFEASGSGGTAPYTFNWSFGDGTSATGSSTGHTYSVKGSYFVTLTATDANAATIQVQHMILVLPETLTADFSANPSPATAGEPVTFTATVSGGTGPYVFSWSFGDGTIILEGTNPISHTYTSAGTFQVLLTVTDANNALAPLGHDLSVLPRPVATVLLTFDGCDVDAFENGVGELSVFINGQLVVNIPAGLHGLTGSGKYAPYNDVCVSFGPFDITSSIHEGLNTLVFQNPLSSHFSTIKNIRVVQDGTVLLFDPRTRSNSPGPPEVLTFSVPPIVLTSFQTNSAAFVSEPVAFTATFTGGIGPFKCTFSFGDGSGKSVTTTEHSCSATHTYWSARLRTATVRVRGVALADDVRGSLLVRVEPQPGCASDDDDNDNGDDNGDEDECLSWSGVISEGKQQTFTAQLTNPASVPVLIRLDFTITRPDGSKETFISPSFALNPGQTLKGLNLDYAPSGGLGTYCFKAPLKYGTDTNNNGVLEDGEILGKRSAISGCFQVVNAASLAISPFLFFGTALLPKARSKISRYFEKKNRPAA